MDERREFTLGEYVTPTVTTTKKKKNKRNKKTQHASSSSSSSSSTEQQQQQQQPPPERKSLFDGVPRVLPSQPPSSSRIETMEDFNLACWKTLVVNRYYIGQAQKAEMEDKKKKMKKEKKDEKKKKTSG